MKLFSEYADEAGESLAPTLRAMGEIPEELLQPMIYSLTAGGKHLRGALLLAVLDAMNTEDKYGIRFACAIEMIHTYSLIHDDLPVMDNDDFRRGKPTCHKLYGEGMAVLAGDGLLSAACELMMKCACEAGDLRHVMAAESIIHRAGVNGMAAGQAKDISSDKQSGTLQSVEYISLHKTSDMIIAPLESGMILSGADDAHLAAAVQYGTHLGLAFQITDDILDITGDAKSMGKKTGMDENKQTWVSVHGLEKARDDAHMHTEMACDACSLFDTPDGFFAALATDYLTRVK